MGQIPDSVSEVVGEVIGSHYYNHERIENLFVRAGAPSPVPDGSCVVKTKEWLKRCSDDPSIDALSVLGRVLEPLMGYEADSSHEEGKLARGKERISRVLENNGFRFEGGSVTRSVRGLPASVALESLVRSRNLPSVEIEISRALNNIESDPPAAVCAANSLLEALMKVYIEDEGLEMPNKRVLKSLWKVVQRDLGQSPDQVEDVHIKKVLSGQTSVVDGIAGLRTHASSAHGHGRKRYRIDPRIARHAVNAAQGFALFLLETWELRRASRSSERARSKRGGTRATAIPDVLSRIQKGHFASLQGTRNV